jgi:hypothetical protein
MAWATLLCRCSASHFVSECEYFGEMSRRGLTGTVHLVFENAGSACKWIGVYGGIQDDVGREILQRPGILVHVCSHRGIRGVVWQNWSGEFLRRICCRWRVVHANWWLIELEDSNANRN